MSLVATIVDGAALGKAAWTSAAIGLGVLVVAAIGVAASLRAQDERSAGDNAGAIALTGVSVVCAAGLLVAVVAGIYLIAK